MFRIADSFRIFISKFWDFVFEILSYTFCFKGERCCKKAENIENSVQKEKGSDVDDEEKVNKIEGETENSVMGSITSKYEFFSGKNISGFFEEPKRSIISVQYLYRGSEDYTNGGNKILHAEGEEAIDQAKEEDSIEKVFIKQVDEKSFTDTSEVFSQDKIDGFFSKFFKNQEEETLIFETGEVNDVEKTEDSDSVDKVLEKQEEEIFDENEKSVFTEFRFLPNYYLSAKVQILSEDSSVCEEEEVESNEITLYKKTHDSRDVTFDSDDDYIELKIDDSHSLSDLEKTEEEYLFRENAKTTESPGLSEESPEENSAVSEEESLSIDDSNEVEDNQEDLVHEATNLAHTSEKFEESSLEYDEFISDSDDEDEHDDLIEQLKMELKNARTGGLPTILEESESTPKTVEELMPLKIGLKFQYKDHIKEIHKFYRSYLEKMRKLDILNFQAMHAIGLFQLKVSGQTIKTQKSSGPTIKSLLVQNLCPCKPRRNEANPVFKLIDYLQKDFELVYVGHLCLSWEILRWQYRKALELQEFDSQQLQHYNQVAGEFQLFQVLLQRFVENEPFEGYPRVQNYVNNRCNCGYFLQVPVIKDDSLKDKNGRKGDEEDAITSLMLTAIIEESMQVYWEFLSGNKDENDEILRGDPEVQDSVDSELLADIRTDYQKKEKRLKEILRCGSCILKQLQKHHGNRFNRNLFFAQIELKLVSRVLTMSKLTKDQLVWCHEKLAMINFCNRKVVLDPSFLLFPC